MEEAYGQMAVMKIQQIFLPLLKSTLTFYHRPHFSPWRMSNSVEFTLLKGKNPPHTWLFLIGKHESS